MKDLFQRIKKYFGRKIGINYSELTLTTRIGAYSTPLNPYLVEYYSSLKGLDLSEALDNVKTAFKHNEIVIGILKKSSEETAISDEEKEVILDTIKDLEYQNETNREILQLLENNVINQTLKEYQRRILNKKIK